MRRRNKAFEFTVNSGKPLLPSQEKLLRSDAFVRAIFGCWGSGKTLGAACAFLKCVAENPWTEAYGDNDRPFSIITGVTRKILRDSAAREFKRLCSSSGRSLIRREWKSPDWVFEMVNGHLVKLYTLEGAMEGSSACAVWIDEVHKIRDPNVFLNYQTRSRDPLAKSYVVIASGLPLAGWLPEVFNDSGSDPTRLVLFTRPDENTYLPPHYLVQMRRSVSEREWKRMTAPGWLQPEAAVYYEYDPRKHLVKDAGDANQPCHLGIDAGEKSAVVWAQERKRKITELVPDAKGQLVEVTREDKGLHIVDEYMPEQQDLRAVMRVVATRKWKLVSGKSKAFIDPNMTPSEIRDIRAELGDSIEIVQRSQKGGDWLVEEGHRAVNRALCDAWGNARLTINVDMPRERRSLIPCISRFERNADGRPKRDNVSDHVNDCLRYLVQGVLPLLPGQHQVRSMT